MQLQFEPSHASSQPFPQTEAASHWYAVHVRSNSERNVSQILEHKGVEQFLPTYRSRRIWADRVKMLDAPLFPGYVFCRIPTHARNLVTTIEGVVGFVSAGRLPIPLPVCEIDAIRTILQSQAPAQPWPFLKVGQTVQITGGPLCGIQGLLVRVKSSWRLVVSVTLLERSVVVEIDAAYVSALR